MGKLYYVFLLCALIILVFLHLNAQPKYDILWTCTAYFDYNRGERWIEFQKAVDSIVSFHSQDTLNKIQKWVVVNEYDPHPKHDYARIIAEKYPWITYIQKPPGKQGISESVNYLLTTYVSHSRLWIHWEETWIARAPFLDRAIDIMNRDTDITQLTFVYKNGRTEWSDIEPQRLKCVRGYCIVKPHADTQWYDRWDGSEEGMTEEVHAKWAITWPLYQLLPSINRSAFYGKLPLFHTQHKHAEWLYAREWLRRGGVKAMLRDGTVWRPTEATHVSTHD